LEKKFGLNGRSDWEDMEIDDIVENFNELRKKIEI
jgi:hypothetical protein